MSDGTIEIPAWMIILAFEYAIGGSRGNVHRVVSWLVEHWNEVPDVAKKVIQERLERAFDNYETAKKNKFAYNPFGIDSEIEEWEKLRAIWR